MRFKHTTGFTLIELMVVASVVTTLASVVLASVQTVRIKGVNARIQMELLQLRNEFEQNRVGDTYPDFLLAAFIDPNGVVAINSFSSNPKIVNLINDITAKNGGLYGGNPIGTDSTCIVNGGPGPKYTVHDVSYNQNTTYVSTNGLTIYVTTQGGVSCAPVTGYAIYAEKAPISLAFDNSLLQTAYASVGGGPSQNNFAGYYCIDSKGSSLNTAVGWIPNGIIDGKCH